MTDEENGNQVAPANDGGTQHVAETPVVAPVIEPERDSRGRIRGGKSGKKRRSRGTRTRGGKKRGHKFAENAAMGMTDHAAALNAGYSESVAKSTKSKLWIQPDIQNHYQLVMQSVLPPGRVAKIMSELLEGKVSTTTQRLQRVTVDGKVGMQVMSATKTEMVDRAIQLRALEMAAEHGALIPSRLRMSRISSSSIEEVLQKAEAQRIEQEARMTPTWMMKQRVLTPAVEPKSEPEPQEVYCCDSCGKERCIHGRCPICDTCTECAASATAETAMALSETLSGSTSN